MTVEEILENPTTALRKLLPLMDFANIYERNEWHMNQSILDHMLRVFWAIEKFAVSPEDHCQMPLEVLDQLKEYLQQRIDDQHTRLELLKLAALLHDIGKRAVLLVGENGATTCSEHAAESCRLFRALRSSIELTDDEASYVELLISKHHDVDKYLGSLSFKEIEEGNRRFRTEASTEYVELVLLFLADFEGSDVSPEISARRLSVYNLLCAKLAESFLGAQA